VSCCGAKAGALRGSAGNRPVRILIIDNYDSFTYNLVQYFAELGAGVAVARNDAVTLAGLLARRADGLVISPGPGRPEDAGLSVEAVRTFAEEGIPVLGVCLGHQAVGVAFGASVARADTLMHGKTSAILHDGEGIFHGIPSPFHATRYHSLVLDESSCWERLQVSARTREGQVMGVRHRSLPVEGVQFHPESILTGEGKRLLDNYLRACRRRSP
jgi:anthranilate synthase/aminodeoxychorismate synthase-like glutamine amidotransferase